MHALGEWVLCTKVEQEKSDSGRLFLAPGAQLSHFEVTSVGKDVTVDVVVGNHVLFYTKNAIAHENLVLVHQKDLFLVL